MEGLELQLVGAHFDQRTRPGPTGAENVDQRAEEEADRQAADQKTERTGFLPESPAATASTRLRGVHERVGGDDGHQHAHPGQERADDDPCSLPLRRPGGHQLPSEGDPLRGPCDTLGGVRHNTGVTHLMHRCHVFGGRGAPADLGTVERDDLGDLDHPLVAEAQRISSKQRRDVFDR